MFAALSLALVFSGAADFKIFASVFGAWLDPCHQTRCLSVAIRTPTQ
jgi:hypothetical protein